MRAKKRINSVEPRTTERCSLHAEREKNAKGNHRSSLGNGRQVASSHTISVNACAGFDPYYWEPSGLEWRMLQAGAA